MPKKFWVLCAVLAGPWLTALAYQLVGDPMFICVALSVNGLAVIAGSFLMSEKRLATGFALFLGGIGAFAAMAWFGGKNLLLPAVAPRDLVIGLLMSGLVIYSTTFAYLTACVLRRRIKIFDETGV